MYTLLAHHGTANTPAEGSLLRAGLTKTVLEPATKSSTAYTGHLGVLRQERPTLERQRRYDFWFKRA